LVAAARPAETLAIARTIRRIDHHGQ
jgi:hypothetical protein